MWCENSMCGKKNLSHEDVTFDHSARKVFCHDCAKHRIEVVDLTMLPPPPVDTSQRWLS